MAQVEIAEINFPEMVVKLCDCRELPMTNFFFDGDGDPDKPDDAACVVAGEDRTWVAVRISDFPHLVRR